MPTITRSNTKFLAVYNRNADSVYRLCYSFMKNRADAEDLTQETFLKLLAQERTFENERHEKAWLIVTASNLCRDSLKKWWRRHENIDDQVDLGYEQSFGDADLRKALLSLKPEYKTAVYLFYYEGYSTAEIAAHLQCPEATVRSRLSRARGQLRTLLGGDQR